MEAMQHEVSTSKAQVSMSQVKAGIGQGRRVEAHEDLQDEDNRRKTWAARAFIVMHSAGWLQGFSGPSEAQSG